MVAAATRKYFNFLPNSSQRFGAYRSATRRHRGTDFAHGRGTLVPALLNGTVTGKRTDSSTHGFGNQITVRSTFAGRLYFVSYAHADKPQSPTVGSTVTQGAWISSEGTTGATSGACCHVEVYDVERGAYIDPMILIKQVLATTTPAGGTGARPSSAIIGIQQALNTLGYKLVVDGLQGVKTTAAIKDFQKKHGLVVDGVWGPKTNTKYNQISVSRRPTVRRGSRNSYVKIVQRKLGLVQDGIFGPTTESKVRGFQHSKGLVADGVVGPKTWVKLGY